MPKYRVRAEWTIVADDENEAIDVIENAVARMTDADLETSEAELEEGEPEDEQSLEA